MPASTKIDRRPGPPSVNAVTLVSSLRHDDLRHPSPRRRHKAALPLGLGPIRRMVRTLGREPLGANPDRVDSGALRRVLTALTVR
jgi:hypothetical protein